MNVKKLKQTNNGITLIALVITIIVLLILAGVTIATLAGENGILTKATEAKENTEMAQIKEEAELCRTEMLQGKYIDNEEISYTRLIIKLNTYFENSYIQANRVVVWNEKYDVIVERDLSIKVEKHKKVPSDDIGIEYEVIPETIGQATIRISVIIGNINPDYTQYAKEILENKTTEEKETIFVEGSSFWDMNYGDIDEPYKNLEEVLKKWEELGFGKFDNLTQVYEAFGYNSLDEFLIGEMFVKPEDFIIKMQPYQDIIVEDEENNLLGMEDIGVFDYEVNENKIYKFTISYQGIMKEIEVEVNEIKNLEIELPEDTGKEELILEYQVESNDVIELPYNITNEAYWEHMATYDFTIDWGDGTVEEITNDNIVEKSKHKYVNGGIYDIKIKGIYEYLSADTHPITSGSIIKKDNIDKLIKIKQWGTVNLLQIDLENIKGLTEIASPTKSSFENLRHIKFFECSGLKELPDNLFANCKNLLGRSSIFEGCESLVKVGDNLFANSSLSLVDALFEDCTKLESVGKNMLFNCTHLLDAMRVFRNCTSLKNVGEDMSAGCRRIEDVRDMFYNCTSLTRINENLFAYCRNIENFQYTFAGCTSLKGNAIPLWDRVENGAENEYIGNPDGMNCYKDCTGLSNYDAIPEYWKDYGEYFIQRKYGCQYYLQKDTDRQGIEDVPNFEKASITYNDQETDISEYIQADSRGYNYIDLEYLFKNEVIEKNKKYILKIEKNGKIVQTEVEYDERPQ